MSDSPIPQHWLIKNDDIVIPMQEAADALAAIDETIGAFCGDNGVQMSDVAWAFLSEAIIEHRKALSNALKRIQAVEAELLVPAEGVTFPMILELYEERGKREVR